MGANTKYQIPRGAGRNAGYVFAAQCLGKERTGWTKLWDFRELAGFQVLTSMGLQGEAANKCLHAKLLARAEKVQGSSNVEAA